MKWSTNKITGLAMISAISYAVMLMGFRFMASAPFLKYEAKDVILTIGGFMYGPAEALAAAVVVALAEMLTVSESGIIGFMMNFLAAASYAGIASLVYKKNRTAEGAVVGLAFGSLSLAAVMLLWNYIVTPIYMNTPREIVAGMLIPVFLPFNLIKAGLNSAFVLLIYKPLSTALRAARLLPADSGKPLGNGQQAGGSRFKLQVNMGLLISAVALLVICAFVIFFVFRK